MTRNTICNVVMGLAAISCSAIMQAQITKKGNEYLLRVKYKPGSTISYSISSSSPKTATDPAAELTVPFTYKVISVKGDETTMKISFGPSKVNGSPLNSSVELVDAILDDRGKLVKSSKQGFGNMTGFVLPEKPVKLGVPFSIKNESSINGSILEVTGSYTLTGFKTVKGEKVAVLKMVINGTGLASVKGGGTALLSVDTGQVVESRVDQAVTILQKGKSFTRQNNVTILRK